MGQQVAATVESVTSALNTLGIDLRPLKARKWDRGTALRVLKIATRSAYRYKALETHPDRYPHKVEEFRKASEARDLLDSITSSELHYFLGNVVEEKKPPKREMKMVSITIVFHLPVIGWGRR